MTAIVPVRVEHAPIRTYHPRQGRLSGRHRAALAELGPRLTLTVEGEPVDFAEVFGRRAPVVLEIGSGMGEATAAMAAADPDRDYLAVEVHRPGIANLLALAGAAGLTNLRVVEGDALDLLRNRIRPATLDAVHVFFPDPWPKARHHKRRLITPSNVELIRSRLRIGGILHCVTDSVPYAEAMASTPGMSIVDTLTPRPVSKFEQRAREAGRPIVELVFARTARA